MTRRLVTGATGLVGGGIVLELLSRTSDEIFCLVRANSAQESDDRLRAALTAMTEKYECPELADQIAGRVHAIRGDLTWPGCTEHERDVPRVDEVWHCAASLRYEDEYRDEINASNITGTENVLAMARRAGAGVFNHVSTAYVAGRTLGTIPEAPAPGPQACNNEYERSKVGGERLVLAAAADMRVRILRPGIVIGHSATYHAPNFTGMYGFARQLLVFKRTVSRRLGTFLTHGRVRLLAEPDIESNLIPVDAVARNAVTIGLSDSAATFYHLTNAASPTVADTVSLIFRLTGLREPLWVNDKDGFTSLDEILDEGMIFYRSYLVNDKTFDRTNTDAVCGAAASTYPLPPDELAPYIEYFLHSQRTWTAAEGILDRVVHEPVA